MKRYPRAVREYVGRYGLRIQADLHALDSAFQANFANAYGEQQIALLQDYAVRRFDRLCTYATTG